MLSPSTSDSLGSHLVNGSMDRRNFIKECRLLGLALLPSTASTFLIGSSSAASANSRQTTEWECLVECGEKSRLRISVLGVGGLGVRIVSRISKYQFRHDPAEVSVRYFALDTDRRSLALADALMVHPLSLPSDSDRGKNQDVRGKSSQVARAVPLNLASTEMTIIVAESGIGGRNGLTQEIVRHSKEVGAFTAVFASSPSSFESAKVSRRDGVGPPGVSADTVLRSPRHESQPDMFVKTTVTHAESYTERQIKSLIKSVSGLGLVSSDLEEIRSIFSEPGTAMVASGWGGVSMGPAGVGSDANNAVIRLLESLPEIGTARSVLVMLSINKGFKLSHYCDCVRQIRSKVPEDAVITAVASLDQNLPKDVFAMDVLLPHCRSVLRSVRPPWPSSRSPDYPAVPMNT